MIRSVRRAPVAYTRKYVMAMGDNTVASDTQLAMAINHNPHHTAESPK
jgi:hypothetical protein